MAQQNIILGTPNNEDGDFVRDAFVKTEANFTELYARTNTSDFVNDGANGVSTFVETNQLGAVAFSNSYNDLDDLPSFSGVSDAVYGVAWNDDTTTGASKNALYDKIETLVTLDTQQTITARKTFNTGTSVAGIRVEAGSGSTSGGLDINHFGSGTSRGVNIQNSSTGNGMVITSSGGGAIDVTASGLSRGIRVTHSSPFGFIAANTGTGIGISVERSGAGIGMRIIGNTGVLPILQGGIDASTITFELNKEGDIVTNSISLVSTVTTGGYTVGTLPAGTIGMRAYVTDATAPTYLGALTGGGAITCPVFYDGTAWISA